MVKAYYDPSRLKAIAKIYFLKVIFWEGSGEVASSDYVAKIVSQIAADIKKTSALFKPFKKLIFEGPFGKVPERAVPPN